MSDQSSGIGSIDQYIAGCPEHVRAKLQELRETIRAAAPDAEERISYQMPAFAQNGILVYFAAFKNHIGFYPTASGIEAFRDELSAYEGSKGAVRFPLTEPLPLDLVTRMVRSRVAENLSKAPAKAREASQKEAARRGARAGQAR